MSSPGAFIDPRAILAKRREQTRRSREGHPMWRSHKDTIKVIDETKGTTVVSENIIDIQDKNEMSQPVGEIKTVCVTDTFPQREVSDTVCHTQVIATDGHTAEVIEQKEHIDISSLSLSDELVVVESTSVAKTPAEIEEQIQEYAIESSMTRPRRHHHHKDSAVDEDIAFYRSLDFHHDEACSCRKCYSRAHYHGTSESSGTGAGASASVLGTGISSSFGIPLTYSGAHVGAGASVLGTGASASVGVPFRYSGAGRKGRRARKDKTTATPATSPTPVAPPPETTEDRRPVPTDAQIQQYLVNLNLELQRYRISVLPQLKDETRRQHYMEKINIFTENLSTAREEITDMNNLPETRASAKKYVVYMLYPAIRKFQEDVQKDLIGE